MRCKKADGCESYDMLRCIRDACYEPTLSPQAADGKTVTCLWCKRPVTEENKFEHIHTIDT